MELSEALPFVQARKNGVLTTIRANGRPQLSNILYVAGDYGAFRISVTDGRAKTNNIRRDPRVSLYVPGDNFWQYVVIEGTAELSPVAADPHDETVEQLVSYYRAGSGEHPDWDDYRRVMVAERRLIITLRPGARLRDRPGLTAVPYAGTSSSPERIIAWSSGVS